MLKWLPPGSWSWAWNPCRPAHHLAWVLRFSCGSEVAGGHVKAPEFLEQSVCEGASEFVSESSQGLQLVCADHTHRATVLPVSNTLERSFQCYPGWNCKVHLPFAPPPAPQLLPCLSTLFTFTFSLQKHSVTYKAMRPVQSLHATWACLPFLPCF